MSKKIAQSIVIILGILILISFLALIYGMYLKISTSDKNISNLVINYSLNLNEKEKITDIEVLDENRLFILLESDNIVRGAIYDIKKNKVIRFIER